MYNPYGLDPWSKFYRKEALREVSKGHVARRMREVRAPHQPRRLMFSLRRSLALLRGA